MPELGVSRSKTGADLLFDENQIDEKWEEERALLEVTLVRFDDERSDL